MTAESKSITNVCSTSLKGVRGGSDLRTPGTCEVHRKNAHKSVMHEHWPADGVVNSHAAVWHTDGTHTQARKTASGRQSDFSLL